jgi:hypothetical protein
MTSFRRSSRALLLALLVPLATPAGAESPAAPSDADVRELEQRLEALERQVDQLEAAKDDVARRGLMQENWRAMQDYMGFVHGRWGAGAPWMVDPDARSGPGASACPMLGGTAAAWPLPEGVTPKPYGDRLHALMRTLNAQMTRIAQATDASQRERLLQEHWQSMYRGMQEMRGMGWIWAEGSMGGAPAPPREAQPLPDADSPGAKLVATYCKQCHAAPAPTLHTAAEWTRVIDRMHLRSQGRGTVVGVPSDEELDTILTYMKQHAR